MFKFALIEVYPESNTASMIIHTLAIETCTAVLPNSSLPSETELMGKSGIVCRSKTTKLQMRNLKNLQSALSSLQVASDPGRLGTFNLHGYCEIPAMRAVKADIFTYLLWKPEERVFVSIYTKLWGKAMANYP